MPELTILNREQIAALLKEHGQRRKQSWALKRGGEVTIYALGNESVHAVCADPEKLNPAEIEEIEKILTKAKAKQSPPTPAATETPAPAAPAEQSAQ